MSIKTYVLVERLAPSAPIYQRINAEQRVRIDKLPKYEPFLKVTYRNKDGINETIRYKHQAQSIYLKDQIEKEKIEANEPFTQSERNERLFRNGVKVTDNVLMQQYLDAYPGNEKFKGYCADVPLPEFRELDRAAEIKTTNEEFKKRVKAASLISDLDLKGMQDMLIRLNGGFFLPPDDEGEALSMLVSFLDNAEEEGLDAILKDNKSLTVDDEMTVFLGNLLKEKVISFEAEKNQVSKMINGKWVAIKEIPDELDAEERKRLFAEFLISDNGKLTKDDLQKSLKDKTSKKP